MSDKNKRYKEKFNKQTKNIMVSVAFYAYNEEKFVCKAIESVINQKTNFKYEIIVHDDASTDLTAKILKKYERKYPELIKGIFQDENQYQKGIYISSEYVEPVAKGKYMAYCDGDDYWTDEYKLQKQVDFLESHPEYVMCTHGFKFLYEKKGKMVENHIYNCNRNIEPEDFIKWNDAKMPQIGTWLYRRELAVNRPELFRAIAVEKVLSIFDQPLGVYLSLRGKVWYMDEIMSVWRRYETSVSSRMLTDNAIAFTENKIKFLEGSKKVFRGKCSIAFAEEIEKQQMYLCFYKKEYGKMLKYRTFKTLPVSMKIRVYIGCLSPKLYDFLREVKQKIG